MVKSFLKGGGGGGVLTPFTLSLALEDEIQHKLTITDATFDYG